MYLSIYPFMYLFTHPSICLSVYLSIHLSLCLSILHLSLSVFLAIHLSLSFYLSIYLYLCLSNYHLSYSKNFYISLSAMPQKTLDGGESKLHISLCVISRCKEKDRCYCCKGRNPCDATRQLCEAHCWHNDGSGIRDALRKP